MRILVLGGTAWLGGQVARTAHAAGHHVTCLARGQAGSAPDGVAFVAADRDRDDALEPLFDNRWDLTVDVSRHPGHVRRAVAALADRCMHFVFVSTGNVYADHSTPGADEAAELLPRLDADLMESMETYGEAKVACEQFVLDAFGADRTLIARSGLIGGPGDWSGRTGYYPLRCGRPSVDDGRVLVPDTPDLPTQVIDVRDLAAWLVDAGLARTSGIFNAGGDTVPLGDHLGAAREVARHQGELAPAPEEWLLAHEVEPWMGARSLPMWLPRPDYAGFSARDSSASRAAGLQPRPLAETLADTLAWELAQTSERPHATGLTANDERALLAELSGR